MIGRFERSLSSCVMVVLSFYPTDTIYAIGCDINSVKAVQRVSAIRGVKAEKANFSMICKVWETSLLMQK